MGCNCGKSKTASSFTVKLPGQSSFKVTTEARAQELTKGVRGASYSAAK